MHNTADMAAEVGEGHHNGFSFIVKESRDQQPASDDKMPSTTAAVKYAKSSHSISSKDSLADMKITAVIETNDDGQGAVPPDGQMSSTDVKKKSPKVKKCQVDVDNRSVEKAGSSVEVEQKNNLEQEAKAETRVSFKERNSSEHKAVAGKSSELKGEDRHMKRDRKFKHRNHSLWYRLRRRHVHMGVVEVNAQHPFYLRLQALSAGMQRTYNDPDRLGPVEHLHSADYKLVKSKELTLEDGTPFLFEDYAPTVFATIRRAVSVEEDAFMESIISHNQAYLEFISNSRSGQDFFLSANMRYLIKTNKKRDVQFLLSILGDYLQHFLSHPHSLLVKYVGCYSLKLPGKKKIFFLVMQNIFYPADGIDDRFDVKGCTAGRYQQPDSPGSHTITVLKDQNFFQEELQLGSNSDWFINQLTADAMFLRDLNVMDYSLLVGRRKLHESELDRTGLPVLVNRIARSSQGYLNVPVTLHSYEIDSDSGMMHSFGHASHTINSVLPGSVPEHSTAKVLSSQHSNGLRFPHSLTAIAESFANQRRRLLPDCSNALHIIDGPEYRYFFGIVDFLTRWTLKQKAARLWKVVKYGCGEHSTMPPQYYYQRFVRFISARVS